MAANFASTGDMAEKKITFAEIGRDLYAFTAEGDPNSGIIVGDDGVIVIDAQATPADGQPRHRAGAQRHRQAHQVCRAVALSRRARARRLGLQGAGDPGLGDLPRHDRRARQGGLGFRVRPLPAPVPRRREHPRPHLADGHVPPAHDALPRQAPRRAAPHRPRPHRRRHRRLRAGRQRGVLGRHRRVQVGLLLRRRALHRLAGHALRASTASRPTRWCRAAATRWWAPTRSPRASP